MNPMNLLFSFVFAKSSAEKYNVSDTQKLQNTALISGLVSTNPVFSYLLIENEAKNLEVKDKIQVAPAPVAPVEPVVEAVLAAVPVEPVVEVKTESIAEVIVKHAAKTEVSIETLKGAIDNIITQLSNLTQVATNNVISPEIIQKIIDDSVTQQNKLEEIVSNVISSKISSSFLKSDDAEIERLTNEIKAKTFPYFIEDQVKTFVNELESFKEILNNKFIDKLEAEDKKIFDELKEVSVTKEAVIKELEAMKIINSSPSLGSFLPILLSMRFDPRIADLKSKLIAIESANKVVTPTPTSAPTPIIDKASITPKPTSTKK